MERSKCLTLGEFREMTKDMPDRTVLMTVSHMQYDEAVPLTIYPFDTTLSSQDVFLFEPDISESVKFTDI